MELGALPIINENDTVSTEEISIGRQRYSVRHGGGQHPGGSADPAVGHRRPVRQPTPMKTPTPGLSRVVERLDDHIRALAGGSGIQSGHRRHGDQAAGGSDRHGARAARWSSPTVDHPAALYDIADWSAGGHPLFGREEVNYDHMGYPEKDTGGVAAAAATGHAEGKNDLLRAMADSLMASTAAILAENCRDMEDARGTISRCDAGPAASGRKAAGRHGRGHAGRGRLCRITRAASCSVRSPGPTA